MPALTFRYENPSVACNFMRFVAVEGIAKRGLAEGIDTDNGAEPMGGFMEDLENAGDVVVDLGRMRQNAAPCPIERAEAHWNDIRGARLMPERSEISPAAMSDTLDQSFILERISKGQMRFRVVGSTVAEFLGHDVRGMPLSVAFRPEDRRLLSEVLAAVMEEPSQIRLCFDDDARGEMILLPLRSDLGDVTRVLGAVRLPRGPHFQHRKLGISSIHHKTLVGFAKTPQPMAQATESRKPRSVTERGHLTLVKTD